MDKIDQEDGTNLCGKRKQRMANYVCIQGSVTFGLKRFKPSGLSESKLSCVTAEKTWFAPCAEWWCRLPPFLGVGILEVVEEECPISAWFRSNANLAARSSLSLNLGFEQPWESLSWTELGLLASRNPVLLVQKFPSPDEASLCGGNKSRSHNPPTLAIFFPLEKSSSFGFWLLSQQEHNPVQKQRGTTVT
jgi:hypothetical protein